MPSSQASQREKEREREWIPVSILSRQSINTHLNETTNWPLEDAAETQHKDRHFEGNARK